MREEVSHKRIFKFGERSVMKVKESILKLIENCTDEVLLIKVKEILEASQGPNIINEPGLPIRKMLEEIYDDPIVLLRSQRNNHRILQIDLEVVAKDEELLEDVYDLIEIERRKDEETTPWEKVKQNLGLDNV